MAAISKGTIGLLGEIVSLLHGAVASGLRLTNNLVTSGFKMAFQFNESAMAFSRQAGLTAKQAQAYTEVLTTRAKELGEKYGIAAEEVTKLERNLAKATGRVIMLSNAQADMQVAINRTVGEETANQFSQMMMRTMGAQYSTVQGAVSKAYALAAKSGLDAAGMAAKVGQNLAMANRLTFRNGVDGLTKMVALSEKLGFNVQTIEAAANSFMDLQDAIENSAKMTMLGGAAGAFGGNPLDMTYEANYDPEAFAERLTRTLGGYAQFDEKTGMARMNAMSRDFVKGIADAMHISLDEASTIAKKQAEIRYKNSRFGVDIDRLTGGDEKMKDFFLNKAQYNPAANNGRGGLQLTDRSGELRDLNYFLKDEHRDELEEMMRFNNMTDEEIVREQAEAVVSIKDRLEGYFTSIQALFAEKIAPFLPNMQKFLGDIYRIVVPHLGQIAQNVKELLGTLFMKENIDKVKDGIATIAATLIGFGKFVTSSWKMLLTGVLLGPLLGAVSWGFNQVLAFQNRNAIGGGAGGNSWLGNMFTKMHNGSAHQIFSGTYAGTRRLRNQTWWSSTKAGARAAWRGTPMLAKGTAALGVGLSAIQGFGAQGRYNDRVEEINNSNMTQKEKQRALDEARIDRNSEVGGAVGAGVGTLLGTFFFGPLGGMIGGAVGQFAGQFIGKYIDPIWDMLKKLFSGIAKALGFIADYTIGLPIKAIGAAFGKDWSLTKMFDGVIDFFKGGNNNVEGAHDGGVNTPQSGAKTVVSDAFRDVANGVRNLSITEPGESFVTTGQRDNINEWIKAKEVGSVAHFDGGVNTPQSGAKTAVSNAFRDVSNGVRNLSITEPGESFITPGQRDNTNEWIKAKEVGGVTHFVVRPIQASNNVNDTKLTVNDINVKFSGTLRLDTGNLHRDIDIKEILDDPTVRTYIANMIRNEFSYNTYMKKMNDTKSTMGYSEASGVVGLMRNT